MKSHKLQTIILLICIVCLTAASCDLFTERSRVYTGPAQIEFYPLSSVQNEGAGEISVEVQLIGEQRSEPLPIEFVVVDSTTTAEAGTHYSLISSSPVTIPADSSETIVTLEVTGTSLNAGESRVLELALVGNESENIETGPHIRFFNLTIRGQ